jgi:hypothetical protein
MARVKNSALLKGVSGTIAELVIKNYSGKTVITRKPNMGRIKPSPLQTLYKNVFKEAVAYAISVSRDPDKKAAFQKVLKPGQTVYHAALSHYLRKRKEEMMQVKATSSSDAVPKS